MTGAALLNQLVTGISGLILPVYILTQFGSNVNGLIASIGQFLAVISFMDMGVGAVVQSSLYKPLENNDHETVSKILVAAEKFYRTIAKIFIIYVLCLAFIYPVFVKQFGSIYVIAMVCILAIGNFSQFYFGITYQTLLSADQRAYVQFFCQTIATILNLLISIFLIKIGASIHVVKLFAMIVFLIRPFGVNLYAKKHYAIDKKVPLDRGVIKQKWNGFAQHLSSVVLSSTDVVVLTVFSDLKNVSIYAIYYNVLIIIRKTFESLVNGFQALFGNLWAIGDRKRLIDIFDIVEWGIHSFITLGFTVCAILIVPFVSVYTAKITDAQYINYPFGFIMTLAIFCQCMRLPYMILVKAAGHYKETQTSAIIEMLINIIISVLTVIKLGLIGVAVGTLAAMLFRSVYLAYYVYNHLLSRSIIFFAKQCVIDFFVCFCTMAVSSRFITTVSNYRELLFLAITVGIIAVVCFFLINILFRKKQLLSVVKLLKNENV